MKVSRSKRSSNTFYQKWKKGEPIRVLFIGCLFFALVLVPTMYAGIYWSVLGAIFAISVPLCLAFGIFVAVKGRVESVVLAFLTFVVCMISSFSLVEYMYIAQGDVVRDISVSEARNFPQGRIFELHDARFQCQYRGFYLSDSFDRHLPGREVKQSYFICPLVSENWTPADPVPAWSRQEFYDDREELPTSGTFAAIAPHERHEYGEAIKDVQEKHGLDTFDDAPVLHWVDSLEGYQNYLARVRTGGGITILVLFGGWTIATAIVRVKSYKRPRSHKAVKPPSKTTSATLTTCPHCHVSVREDRLRTHTKKCPERKRLAKAQSKRRKKQLTIKEQLSKQRTVEKHSPKKATSKEQPSKQPTVEKRSPKKATSKERLPKQPIIEEQPSKKSITKKQPSYTPRARIKAIPQALTITLADPRSFFGRPSGQRLTIQEWRGMIIFFLGMLGFAGIMGFFIIRPILLQVESYSQSSLFDTIVSVTILGLPLAGVGIIGIAAFASLLSGFLGREQILFHGEQMTIKISFAGITIRKASYELNRIKNFRCIPEPPKKQGHLQFEYEKGTIECCRGVDGQEAQVLFHQMSELMAHHCYAVEEIIFGTFLMRDDVPYRTIQNPDVSNLTFPYVNLKHLSIQTKSHDFYQVERFLTYAVNYIGEDYLQKHVEVHLYGNPEHLHPNLRYSLVNLCKQVHEHYGKK